MAIISVQKAEIRLNGRNAFLVGSVYGLSSEAEAVEKEMRAIKPTIIALGISQEDLESLINGSAIDVYDSYFTGLSRYGSVSIPSPDLLKSIEYATDRKVEISAIDIGDDEFSKMLYDNVSSLRLVMHSRNVRIKSRNAEDFSREWDRKRNRGGFERINRLCEEKMTEKVVELMKTHEKVFVLLDLPRFDGMLEKIRAHYPESLQTV